MIRLGQCRASRSRKSWKSTNPLPSQDTFIHLVSSLSRTPFLISHKMATKLKLVYKLSESVFQYLYKFNTRSVSNDDLPLISNIWPLNTFLNSITRLEHIWILCRNTYSIVLVPKVGCTPKVVSDSIFHVYNGIWSRGYCYLFTNSSILNEVSPTFGFWTII